MSDDHGPRAGCNYQQCGIPDDAASCPFTQDPGPRAGELRGQSASPAQGLREFALKWQQRELEKKAGLVNELADVLRRILANDSDDVS